MRDEIGFDADGSSIRQWSEMTDDFRGTESNHKYKYEHFGGYNNLGGYVIYFAADPVVFTNEVNLFWGDRIFDESLASVAIDFVVYNGEAN